MTSTRQAEYVLIEAAPPGRGVVPIGVLLHDPSAKRAGVKLRRDWDQIAGEEEQEVFALLAGDLALKLSEGDPEALLRQLEDSASHTIRISGRQPVLLADFDATLSVLYRKYVPAAVLPFRTHLPVYSCRAAAGKWGEQQQVEPDGWIEAPDQLRLTEDMFVARVTGRSMEPVIPDGSLCVFRGNVVGSRQGKRLLIEHLGAPGDGERYTVKRYSSRKRQEGDTWEQESITLHPLNPEFEPWHLGSAGRFRVIGEFVRVLESPAPPGAGQADR